MGTRAFWRYLSFTLIASIDKRETQERKTIKQRNCKQERVEESVRGGGVYS